MGKMFSSLFQNYRQLVDLVNWGLSTLVKTEAKKALRPPCQHHDWFLCPVQEWAYVFPMFLVTAHIPEDSFLLALGILVQFKFQLRLSLPDWENIVIFKVVPLKMYVTVLIAMCYFVFSISIYSVEYALFSVLGFFGVVFFSPLCNNLGFCLFAMRWYVLRLQSLSQNVVCGSSLLRHCKKCISKVMLSLRSAIPAEASLFIFQLL